MTQTARVVGTVSLLLVAGVFGLRQQYQLVRLRAEQKALAGKYSKLASSYHTLLHRDTLREVELTQLHKQANEALQLRNRLTQVGREKNAGPNSPIEADDSVSEIGTAAGQDAGEYLSREEVTFAGFDTPEEALQSLSWASAKADYDQWLASLTPREQERELADPNSLENFRSLQESERDLKGMQILELKNVADGRVELKVRFDREASTVTMIVPMMTVGPEWRLGGQVNSYSQSWDLSDNSKPAPEP